MPNHSARSYLICARKVMRTLGFDDESPKNFIALRQKNNLVSPSDRSIQSMFGRQMSLVKTDVSRAILKIINQEADNQGKDKVSDSNIIQFNSVVIDIGNMIAYLEMRNGSSTDIREDIAVAAGYSRSVIDAAISQRLFPKEVCDNIEHALRNYGVKTFGVREIAGADGSWDVPSRDGGRAFVIHRLCKDNQ